MKVEGLKGLVWALGVLRAEGLGYVQGSGLVNRGFPIQCSGR